MHGLVFAKFKVFIDRTSGPGGWRRISGAAGLESSMYLAMGTYPDEELFALAESAARCAGVSVQRLLEEFGTFLAPDLIGSYQRVIRPEWRVLDLLEHVETTVHHAVRGGDPHASPPALQCRRVSEGEVEILYFSPRKLCSFAVGLIQGTARSYSQTVRCAHFPCMFEGSPHCTFRIRAG